jgi:replicative DNA helicase
MDIQEISDIQSESGVIGTLIYHPEYILHSDFLKPNYFVGKENGSIYWAIQELYREGITTIDAYNLSNKLHSNKAVEKTLEKYNIPSVEEFIELYKETARDSIEEYKSLAQTVTALSFKRSMIKTLNQVEKLCFDKGCSLDKLSNDVYQKLDDLTQEYVTTTEVQTLGEQIDDIWQEIESRRTEDGGYGIPSKYNIFNEYFTYEPTELVVVQAKYKRGKSILLMNEVVHKLKNGVPTLVIDTEMRTRLYTERLISHITGIEIKRVKNGRYSDEEAQKIKECIAWIKEQPFVHIYDPDITNEKIYSYCKMLKYKMGLTFFVFDYIKSNETSTSDNYNILGAKCDFLKNRIAGDLELAVLSACQLNRQGEVADSDKINRYLSVGIKWGIKPEERLVKDGRECGNAYAKIYPNRLGEQMLEDDEEDYLDFYFDGKTMSIYEVEQHERTNNSFN